MKEGDRTWGEMKEREGREEGRKEPQEKQINIKIVKEENGEAEREMDVYRVVREVTG